MTMNDVLSNALLKIDHYIDLGRKKVDLYPSSSLLINVLSLLKDQGYIGNYDVEETSRGKKVSVNLIGKINKIRSIKPRFPVSVNDSNSYESFERRFLLAKDFGILVVSTSEGIMSHVEAKSKRIGGKLIAYCY